jgi:hypothetical protein
MLSPNVTASLDYLSSLGILDYDAAADIAGSKPRYYGYLQGYASPIVPTPMDSVSFTQYNNRGERSWLKTAVIGFLGLGGLYLGGKALLGMFKSFDKISSKNFLSRGKKTIENIGDEVGKTFKKGKKKVQNFGKTPWYKKPINAISDGWDNLVGKVTGHKRHSIRIGGKKFRI